MNFDTACIYYLPKLKLKNNSYEIAEGIQISNADSSKGAKALFDIVSKEDITKVGEPSSYDLCVSITSKNYPPYSDYSEPYPLLNRVTNIIAINTFSPVVEGNVVISKDNFSSAKYIGQLYDFSHVKSEYFNLKPSVISHNNIHNIKKSWNNYSKIWESEKSQGRISNALTFYYYSWNSPYLEPVCINLAIVFELLFAPHSHSETTHQIAYNVAHFISDNPTKREEIYRQMKKFYGKRSSIIHGGLPDTQKIVEPTTAAFKRCSKILRDILINKDLVQTFNDESKRKELMKSFVFE